MGAAAQRKSKTGVELPLPQKIVDVGFMGLVQYWSFLFSRKLTSGNIQTACILHIYNETFGQPDRRERSRPLTALFFSQKANCSPAVAERELRCAVKRKLIGRERAPDDREAQEGDVKYARFVYWPLWENWPSVAKPYVPEPEKPRRTVTAEDDDELVAAAAVANDNGPARAALNIVPSPTPAPIVVRCDDGLNARPIPDSAQRIAYRTSCTEIHLSESLRGDTLVVQIAVPPARIAPIGAKVSEPVQSFQQDPNSKLDLFWELVRTRLPKEVEHSSHPWVEEHILRPMGDVPLERLFNEAGLTRKRIHSVAFLASFIEQTKRKYEMERKSQEEARKAEEEEHERFRTSVLEYWKDANAEDREDIERRHPEFFKGSS